MQTGHSSGNIIREYGAAVRPRIALATSEQWPDLTPDDRLAVAELSRLGVDVQSAVWSRDIDWRSFDLVAIRSTWDYFDRIDEFRAWLDRLERDDVLVVNDVGTLRWNLDKRYLADLANAGASVIPTVIAQPGESLSRIMQREGWRDAVLKPCVSADGNRTRRVGAHDAAQHQEELDELVRGGGALVQQYVPEIATAGELSFIFLGGRFSHCVLKRPSGGEFRVQARYGGTAEPYDADAGLIAQARTVLDAAQREGAYARVDGCVVNGRLLLMELELIEPSLFLELAPDAPRTFAGVLHAACTTGCP